jgi:hypothetical protein
MVHGADVMDRIFSKRDRPGRLVTQHRLRAGPLWAVGPVTWVGVAGFEPAASSSRTSGAAGRLAVVPANSVCWWSCWLAVVGGGCCTLLLYCACPIGKDTRRGARGPTVCFQAGHPTPLPGCPWNLSRDRPHLSGDGPVPWPGSLPGPWFLARVLPEAQCQGWPKAISEGNAKRP